MNQRSKGEVRCSHAGSLDRLAAGGIGLSVLASQDDDFDAELQVAADGCRAVALCVLRGGNSCRDQPDCVFAQHRSGRLKKRVRRKDFACVDSRLGALGASDANARTSGEVRVIPRGYVATVTSPFGSERSYMAGSDGDDHERICRRAFCP